jgi:hypothetical protein
VHDDVVVAVGVHGGEVLAVVQAVDQGEQGAQDVGGGVRGFWLLLLLLLMSARGGGGGRGADEDEQGGDNDDGSPPALPPRPLLTRRSRCHRLAAYESRAGPALDPLFWAIKLSLSKTGEEQRGLCTKGEGGRARELKEGIEVYRCWQRRRRRRLIGYKVKRHREQLERYRLREDASSPSVRQKESV